ncbi:MAG: DNA mismatch repair protein MutS, partial [Candidatus Latescibacterota bacterium]
VDVSRILNIALTTRDKAKKNPIPLAGVPFHAAETYITRLLTAGKKVAICEQVEDASQAKGLVRREVVEVLTPGTSMNSQFLDGNENNFCLAMHIDGTRVGIAIIDVSTGDLFAGEDDLEMVQYLVQGKRIREIIVCRGAENEPLELLRERVGNPFVTELDGRLFESENVDKAIEIQFGPDDAVAPGVLEPLERLAVGALLGHCQELREGAMPQVMGVEKLGAIEYLALDEESIRNLELLEPLHGADKKATLICLIDKTSTSMGGREIRTWLQKPLCHVDMIEERSSAVADVYGDPALHESLLTVLRRIDDIQRIAARISARKAIPREFHALRESLEHIPKLKEILSEGKAPLLGKLAARLKGHGEIANTIGRAVVDDPPGHLREGGVIRQGFSDELDTLLEGSRTAKKWIAGLEKRERERTRIGSLKVGFNKVFGYYIEVSKTHVKSVPDDYVGKQTLVNAERYFTEALKQKEQLILENEEERIACEQKIFDELCAVVSDELPALQETARAVGQIDTIQSLAAAARQHRFKRPVVDESSVIELVGNRHPVLERIVSEPFVPNDLHLDSDKKQFALITGPNMSGKSTFLRQVALAVVLAQMGSFVPADRARIGLVDKIFTRVGATDRLSKGESTFLVEMKETANILDQMSDRSLVLLDEVGRGTSTYDGLSIAWAVSEYLLQGVHARPKTLFATHFHELTQLRSAYPRLVNLKITIREWEGGIIFLRKVVPGTSERSYGIHAARVAGLPALVLRRAEEIHKTLELRRNLLRQGVPLEETATGQASLFEPRESPTTVAAADATLAELRRRVGEFDIDASTPLDALSFLKDLKDQLDGA